MQTNSLKVRSVTFGEGMPKVCVPIVGRTKEDIIEQAKKIKEKNPDCIELRIDWYEKVDEIDQVNELLRQVREVIEDTVLLFTFRSKNEGGEKDIAVPQYVELCTAACGSGFVDLLDVEAYMQEQLLEKLCVIAHEKDVKVIASNHDFYKTPSEEDILSRLQYMDNMGADMPKIAVMPQSERDVLNLLSATLKYHEMGGDKPCITMSMKERGMISRLTGELVGSVMTFATVSAASAPGQLPIEKVRQVLELLHIDEK